MQLFLAVEVSYIGSHTFFPLFSSYQWEEIIDNTKKAPKPPSIADKCAMQDLISKVLKTCLIFITSISFRGRTTELCSIRGTISLNIFHRGSLVHSLASSVLAKALYPNSFFINFSATLSPQKIPKNMNPPLLSQTGIVGSLLIFFPIFLISSIST